MPTAARQTLRPARSAPTKSEQLRDALLEQMRNGQFKPGERMPTERSLCAQYGMGRHTVRRVLGDLKDLSLITQTVGSGTYVSPKANAALTALTAESPAALTSPAELMDARIALEPTIIAMVVQRATPADLQRMQTCCDKADAATSLEEFEHWDAMLHEAIAVATHNNFISSVFRLMNHIRTRGAWGKLKQRSATPERRREYQREHRALVQALVDRDAARAEQLARAHALHVRANMLA